MKGTLEERGLSNQLRAEAYRRYGKKAPMFITVIHRDARGECGS